MHLLAMMAFAALTATVLAAITNEAETPRERLIFGLKTFGSFIGIGLAISWVIYFIP
ncbi:MAG: hypothetical protein SNJ67_08050 [Chloracidobacterium sp.]|uniref:Uncharacterized protein n=1 Tax=Chloracidobacterium validum TaxID=2821543 RepID=A0ABX8B8X2_9BACT|nr:hypothetical protein [Chloracidobacterium validum]QUW02000.1 hypothetical protein J8C06_06380 [Chloracidobacterium validum]